MSAGDTGTVLLLAATLFSIGLFGALTQTQQYIVMLMMGLELMLGGVILAAATAWQYIAPATAEGQVLIVLAVTAMALETAIGFAVVTALFRSREIDMTDMAAELKERRRGVPAAADRTAAGHLRLGRRCGRVDGRRHRALLLRHHLRRPTLSSPPVTQPPWSHRSLTDPPTDFRRTTPGRVLGRGSGPSLAR